MLLFRFPIYIPIIIGVVIFIFVAVMIIKSFTKMGRITRTTTNMIETHLANSVKEALSDAKEKDNPYTKCDYCGSNINKTNNKCPNCGANIHKNK